MQIHRGSWEGGEEVSTVENLYTSRVLVGVVSGPTLLKTRLKTPPRLLSPRYLAPSASLRQPPLVPRDAQGDEPRSRLLLGIHNPNESAQFLYSSLERERLTSSKSLREALKDCRHNRFASIGGCSPFNREPKSFSLCLKKSFESRTNK